MKTTSTTPAAVAAEAVAANVTVPVAEAAAPAVVATAPVAEAVVAEAAAPVAPVAKVAKAKAAKPVVAKAAKVVKVRGKAKDLMLARKRVTFGASFINGVLGGYHRDVAKMVVLGKELGAGTPAELQALPIDELRTRVADAILKAETLPTSAAYA